MKIRKGFVTNSSSYSSAVIRIQSKELADLLKKYEDTLFPKRKPGLPEAEISIEADCFYIHKWENAAGFSYPPEHLNDLIERFLDGLKWLCSCDDDTFEKLRTEMQDKAGELTDSIQEVEWEFHDAGYDEMEPEDEINTRTFIYDREAGGDGTYEEYYDD